MLYLFICLILEYLMHTLFHIRTVIIPRLISPLGLKPSSRYRFLGMITVLIWNETCKQALESWQYRAAKIVIKTRVNIPKAALLLELWWEPIVDFINRQKVSYYKRLLELPDNRLCKSVFNEMVRIIMVI
jgi:hypothetical protein